MPDGTRVHHARAGDPSPNRPRNATGRSDTPQQNREQGQRSATSQVRSLVVSARIEVRSVAKSFGTLDALAPVDLDIGDGETVTLLGPSGCGKTTLLRVGVGHHRRGEPGERPTDERRHPVHPEPADEEPVPAHRGEPEPEPLGEEERRGRPEQDGHRGERDAEPEDGRVGHEVDAPREVLERREERVGEMGEVVGRRGEVPLEGLLVLDPLGEVARPGRAEEVLEEVRREHEVGREHEQVAQPQPRGGPATGPAEPRSAADADRSSGANAPGSPGPASSSGDLGASSSRSGPDARRGSAAGSGSPRSRATPGRSRRGVPAGCRERGPPGPSGNHGTPGGSPSPAVLPSADPPSPVTGPRPRREGRRRHHRTGAVRRRRPPTSSATRSGPVRSLSSSTQVRTEPVPSARTVTSAQPSRTRPVLTRRNRWGGSQAVSSIESRKADGSEPGDGRETPSDVRLARVGGDHRERHVPGVRRDVRDRGEGRSRGKRRLPRGS